MRSETRLGFFLVLPALTCIVLIALYPVLQTLWMSFFRLQLQFPHLSKWVGLENYLSLLRDSRFLSATTNTFTFTLVSVALELILGLSLALLMHKSYRGRGLVRAAALVPWAIPTVISAMMWKFLYNDQLGAINDILLRLKIIPAYQAWLGSEKTALAAAIIADVWKTTPFMALLLLAGLQVIPEELYEAATVDGASRLKQFTRITLPLLKPAILVALIFRTLDAFRVFDLIYVLTGGGPGNSTETLTIYAYKTLFRNLDFGLGSALSVVIFFMVFGISLIYIRLLSTDEK
ncbi:carbohydrate ABC transporter membrane protein 1, CUT1 family [Thermanaeromonas toyohensis ToBE]|uniref:Carbohydrate ABC transporter membrane protein 1, CUT1 family n=1 Tax=Thermanaeromonas toyohensis ToBE TaxID=698762 RepID=A0A1W1W1Q0_9FIRM|nr:carbohydrate ABC transporter membrane protein 1, CUT1 family [Thermanaeromonas toyohensis ToBE]